MGKNARFAQRKACFSSSDGQKYLFCPTAALKFRLRDPKMTCFGVRRGVFPGSGAQKGLFWGTEVCFPRFGTPKWPVLGHGGRRRRRRQKANGTTRHRGFGAAGKGASGKRGIREKGHRRRNIRAPAATARALRGALGKALLAPGCCPSPKTLHQQGRPGRDFRKKVGKALRAQGVRGRLSPR
jgi:hypothetical protein